MLPYLFCRLNKTQKLLYESTRDFLQLKFEGRANEKSWMAEKDRLLQELDRCREQVAKSRDPEREREQENQILRLSQAERAARTSRSGEVKVIRFCPLLSALSLEIPFCILSIL